MHAWPPASRPVARIGDDVHIWRLSLEGSAALAERLVETLSSGERRRAERFRFARDRDRFVVVRGVLRGLLGRYLDRDPGTLRFRYGPNGKPALRDDGFLRFNVSHSRRIALVAVAAGREVGVDVEEIRGDLDVDGLSRVFSAAERASLAALTGNGRRRAVFGCWTCKEAYAKARGEGLSLPLHRFSVGVPPRDPAALVGDEDHPDDWRRWVLAELVVGPDHAAALAIEAPDPRPRIRCWRWVPEELEPVKEPQR